MKAEKRYLLILVVTIASITLLVVMSEIYKSNSDSIISSDQLITDTVEHLRQAGKLIMNIKSSPNYQEFSKGKTQEGYNDVVTVADITSNQLIKKFLSTRYPKIKVLTEEDYEKDKIFTKIIQSTNEDRPKIANQIDQSSLIAIVDPLDATQEYTEGLYQYTSIMVCFLENNRPLIGITYFPSIDQVFWVHNKVNDSANFDRVAEIFNVQRNTSAVNVIVSRSHAGNVSQWISHITDNHLNVHVVRAGGAGYKSLMVAGNVADIYVHTTAIKVWDVCNGLVFGTHFPNLKTYDTTLNNIALQIDDPVLHRGFILANNTAILSFLLNQTPSTST